MNRMTPAQFARALALIKATDDHERAIPRLGKLIEAAEITRSANQAAREALTQYQFQPDRLADAIPLLRRADPDLCHAIRTRYRFLLEDMVAPPVGPPRKIDFAALSLKSRPYLAGPFLKILVGERYPMLDLDKSDPVRGYLVYVTTGGAADPGLWRSHLPTLSAWFGDGDYELTAATASTITLTRRPPLPKVIPFNPAWLKSGHLFLGIDVATRRPHHAAFDTLSHLLITGTIGMGKSVAVASIVESLLASTGQLHHVYCADPGGIAFARYRGRSAKLTTYTKPEELAGIASDLVALMEQREAELGQTHREKVTTGFVFLLIDEFPLFATPESLDKEAKAAHQRFLGHIMALGRRGRKSGIRLILVTQEPTDRDISTGLRSVLPGALAFRLPIAAHATSLFGELPTGPADPRHLPRGRALYRDGLTGEQVLVQFPLAPTGRPT